MVEIGPSVKTGKRMTYMSFWGCFKWKKTKECIVLVFSKLKKDQNVGKEGGTYSEPISFVLEREGPPSL